MRQIASEVYYDGAGAREINWYLGTICWLLNRPGEKNCTLQKLAQRLGDGDNKYRFAGGWTHTHYFLFEYERSFAGARHAWTGECRRQKEQQEHILPQSRPAHWVALWPNEDRWKEAIHRLGNLVLTQNQRSNNALSNKSITQKISDPNVTYDYSRGLLGEREISDFADDGRGGKTWTKSNILQREISLIEFAIQRWRLPCCDDSGNITLPEEFGHENEPYVIQVERQDGCSEQIDFHDEEE